MLLTAKQPINILSVKRIEKEVANSKDQNFVVTIDLSVPVKVVSTIVTVIGLCTGLESIEKYQDIL